MFYTISLSLVFLIIIFFLSFVRLLDEKLFKLCIFIINTSYNHRKMYGRKRETAGKSKKKFYFLHHEACKQLNFFTFDIYYLRGEITRRTDREIHRKGHGVEKKTCICKQSKRIALKPNANFNHFCSCTLFQEFYTGFRVENSIPFLKTYEFYANVSFFFHFR